jgi:uncharacterized membrane protein
MWIELGYLVFGLLLIAYGFWRYQKKREKKLLNLALGFVSLLLSILLQLLTSTRWIYLMPLGIPVWLVQLVALGLFACFVITIVMNL